LKRKKDTANIFKENEDKRNVMSHKLFILAMILVFSACTSKDQLKKILKENPDVITEAIEANPDKFIDALNNAVKKSQEVMAKRREQDETKALEESFNQPLAPNIRADESIRGSKDAPLTLVEYSDFECPFCSRGFTTVMELMKKYEGKIRFVYKHLPLSFHPQAMPAAQYYEAIRLQSAEMAYKFHDEVYKNQRSLQNGEKFLKETAKKVGANMSKLASDVNSEAVKKRIEADIEEAGKFGFQGTPGFLLNGIPVKGAYPTSHFEELIGKLKEKGKVTL
jgi:protein-disulfide isomerase